MAKDKAQKEVEETEGLYNAACREEEDEREKSRREGCLGCRYFIAGTPAYFSYYDGGCDGDPDMCEHPTGWIASMNFRFPFTKGCKNREPKKGKE